MTVAADGPGVASGTLPHKADVTNHARHTLDEVEGAAVFGSMAEDDHHAITWSTDVDGFSTKEELKAIFHLAWPVVLTMFFQMLLPIVVLAFVGQYLGTAELDAVGLGNSFNNIFGVAIGVGLGSAVDTLASQAHGAKRHKMVGIVLQRALAIVLLACLPCWALWLNAENLLMALDQDPEVARLTGRYCLLTLPMLPGSYIYILLQKYLQAQNIVMPFLWIGLVVNIINVPMLFVFVDALQLGLDGAAICTVAANWLMAIFAFLYIKHYKLHEPTWPGWSAKALQGWWPFMKLGLPGLAMICLEWWTFEICQFLAGAMGEVQLAAQLIILQVASLAFMVALGVGIAATIRVGNLLGAGDHRRAKFAAKGSVGMILCTSLTTAVVCFGARYHVGETFSQDPDVIRTVGDAFLFTSLLFVFDHTQGVLSGILRGIGQQAIGAAINLVGYWIVGMPIAIALAFPGNMEVSGLWAGLLVCSVTQTSAIVAFLACKVDWAKQAALAIERTGDEDQHELGESELSNESFHVLELKSLSRDDQLTAAPDSDSDEDRHHGANEEEGPLLETADEAAAEALALSSKERRALVRQKLMVASAVLAFFALGCVLRLSLDSPTICFPLPDIANATNICGQFDSLLAGSSCSIECRGNLTATGKLQCGALGDMTFVPACVSWFPNTTAAPG